MASVEIYGSSDDLIELEGDVEEEFTALRFGQDDAKEGGILAFSDGTALQIEYSIEGVWRINRLASGSASYDKDEDPGDDENRYSDRVTLTGDIAWCVLGTRIERAKAKA